MNLECHADDTCNLFRKISQVYLFSLVCDMSRHDKVIITSSKKRYYEETFNIFIVVNRLIKCMRTSRARNDDAYNYVACIKKSRYAIEEEDFSDVRHKRVSSPTVLLNLSLTL